MPGAGDAHGARECGLMRLEQGAFWLKAAVSPEVSGRMQAYTSRGRTVVASQSCASRKPRSWSLRPDGSTPSRESLFHTIATIYCEEMYLAYSPHHLQPFTNRVTKAHTQTPIDAFRSDVLTLTSSVVAAIHQLAFCMTVRKEDGTRREVFLSLLPSLGAVPCVL